MNAHLNRIAVALAAAGITAALAQAPAAPAQAPALPEGLVAEPTASLSRAEGPGADVGKALVDEINADQSLKGSKITVQPEEGAITLSGVTQTRAQAKQVGQMAASKVGAEKVVNAIQNGDFSAEQQPAASPDQGATSPTNPAASPPD